MLLLLLFSTVAVQAQNISFDEDYFIAFVEKYPVKAISPCDDFYAHVCSAVPVPEMSFYYKSNKITNMVRLRDYVPLDVKKFVMELTGLVASTEDSSANVASIEAKVTEHCFKNPEQCQNYLTAISTNALNLSSKLSQDEAIELLTQHLQQAVNLSPEEKEQIAKLHGNTAVLHVFLRGLEDPKNVEIKQKFDYLQILAKAAFEQIKAAYLNRIEESPWIQDRNLLAHYQSIKDVELRSYIWNSALAEFYDIALPLYEKCKRSSFGWFKEELLICAYYAHEVAAEKTNLPFFHGEGGLTVNAGYFREQVVVMPGNLLLGLNNGVSAFVTLGLVIGHELGHHIFKSEVTNTPALMPESIDCLKKHRSRVCDLSSPKCWSGNGTASEDAPDVVALAILTDLFDVVKAALEMDASLDMSKEKFFFYSLAADWCTPKPSHVAVEDVHSPNKERMNSLLMHSKFFHETFECKAGDKMYQDPENFCELLGPDSRRK